MLTQIWRIVIARAARNEAAKAIQKIHGLLRLTARNEDIIELTQHE